MVSTDTLNSVWVFKLVYIDISNSFSGYIVKKTTFIWGVSGNRSWSVLLLLQIFMLFFIGAHFILLFYSYGSPLPFRPLWGRLGFVAINEFVLYTFGPKIRRYKWTLDLTQGEQLGSFRLFLKQWFLLCQLGYSLLLVLWDTGKWYFVRLNELTGGESLRANLALVKNNARVGAQVASVADPDPYVFWPPGSWSINQRYGMDPGPDPCIIKQNY